MELGLWIPRVTGCCAATQAPESKKVMAFNKVITININVERHHFWMSQSESRILGYTRV